MNNKDTQLRALTIDARLKKLFPHAQCSLNFGTPWELVVAVILSAQCTDKKVNEVTKVLFAKYPTLASYVSADEKTFAQDIFSTGFYRAKAKHILASAKRVHEVYGGEVPRTMKDLLTLTGVARKTANVVLGNAFGVVEGITVDTHVMRFAKRYGLSTAHTPEKIEQDLMRLLPKKDWLSFTYRAIEHGRSFSPARRYKKENDPLREFVVGCI